MNLDQMYMTPADVCQLLNVEPHHLKALVWQKKINHERVGGRTMLYRSEIEEMLVKGVPKVRRDPDPFVQRKRQEQTHGIPENQQFCNGETK